jgi:uncharacterized BrkB/YihY/UPF0761 family membrane protein
METAIVVLFLVVATLVAWVLIPRRLRKPLERLLHLLPWPWRLATGGSLIVMGLWLLHRVIANP